MRSPDPRLVLEHLLLLLGRIDAELERMAAVLTPALPSVGRRHADLAHRRAVVNERLGRLFGAPKPYAVALAELVETEDAATPGPADPDGPLAHVREALLCRIDALDADVTRLLPSLACEPRVERAWERLRVLQRRRAVLSFHLVGYFGPLKPFNPEEL